MMIILLGFFVFAVIILFLIVAIASDKEERVKKDNYSKYVDAKKPRYGKKAKK